MTVRRFASTALACPAERNSTRRPSPASMKLGILSPQAYRLSAGAPLGRHWAEVTWLSACLSFPGMTSSSTTPSKTKEMGSWRMRSHGCAAGARPGGGATAGAEETQTPVPAIASGAATW